MNENINLEQKRGRSGESRRSILKSSRTILRSSSYRDFSMATVAEDAGVTRRTLYNHFESKDDLYRESREEIIFSLANIISVEIPDVMSNPEGFFHIASHIFDISSDVRHIDYVGSLKMDCHHNPWLKDLYERHIKIPLERIVEIFILNRSHSDSIVSTPHQAKATSKNFVNVIQAISNEELEVDYDGAKQRTLIRIEMMCKAFSNLLNEKGDQEIQK